MEIKKKDYSYLFYVVFGIVIVILLLITSLQLDKKISDLERDKEVLTTELEETKRINIELSTSLDFIEDYFEFLDDINIKLIKQGKYMDSNGVLHEYKQKVSYDKYQELDELLYFYERTIELYTDNGKSTHWQQFFSEQKQKNSAWYQEYLRIESKLLNET